MAKRSPRLIFTEEERALPELELKLYEKGKTQEVDSGVWHAQ